MWGEKGKEIRMKLNKLSLFQPLNVLPTVPTCVSISADSGREKRNGLYANRTSLLGLTEQNIQNQNSLFLSNQQTSSWFLIWYILIMSPRLFLNYFTSNFIPGLFALQPKLLKYFKGIFQCFQWFNFPSKTLVLSDFYYPENWSGVLFTLLGI